MVRNGSGRRGAEPAPGEPLDPGFSAADNRPGEEPASPLLAGALLDAALADQLLAMVRDKRLPLARRQPRFHRVTLVMLLNLQAEDALLRSADASMVEERAELAAVLAGSLVGAGDGRACKAGALAHWLVGKARLHRADVAGARQAFSEMLDLVVYDPPSEELGLATAGFAQVDQQAGSWRDAAEHFQRAARVFAQLALGGSAAACLAEAGFLQLAAGDWMLARQALQRTWNLLEPALAPSLTVRVALACAECEIRLAEGSGTVWLERARGLYTLPASPHEALRRAWTEGLIAMAAGRHAEAELLLEGVCSRLLAEGSLREAATIARDHQAAYCRNQAAAPGAPAAPVQTTFPGADALFRRRRSEWPLIAPQNDLLLPLRALTDRLLRHRGELEDPLGAAQG